MVSFFFPFIIIKQFCLLLGAFTLEELSADKVVVKMEDFTRASNKFVPSISKKDLEYFNQLKDTYNNV